MSNPTYYEQIPVRCQMSIVSVPPVAPVDRNTGEAIKFWRAQDVAIQCAILAVDGSTIDLSNLASIQLLIQKAPTDLVSLVDKSVGPLDINPVITRESWEDGSNQQFAFELSAAEIDLGLEGQESAQFWLIIRGYTASGRILNYGGGYITVFNPGPQLPTPMPGVVSTHQQINSSGDSTVSPSSLLHKEIITFNGIAGTRNVLINPSGLISGCVIELVLVFQEPLVAGILVKVYSGSLLGVLLGQVQTDGFQPTANLRVTVQSDLTLAPLSLAIPAYS